jgi:hypothetical protein
MGSIQLADHLVTNVVDVLVIAGIFEQRSANELDGIPILALHLGVVEAVLHNPTAFLENPLPFGPPVCGHSEIEIRRPE